MCLILLHLSACFVLVMYIFSYKEDGAFIIVTPTLFKTQDPKQRRSSRLDPGFRISATSKQSMVSVDGKTHNQVD
ncbi:hypothetical protein L6452_10851 [Arctium lappa]|uniref:Uncharacterized protein n=1 Tax=Arctium lappa TaxID=4217 RepID=A0ACB9DNH4_ARCLA|nr:hypothetical protein L6452_10851 [Arctium lappa]